MTTNTRFLLKEQPSIPSVVTTLRDAQYLYELKHEPHEHCKLQHDKQAKLICNKLLAELYQDPYHRIKTLMLLFDNTGAWTVREVFLVEAQNSYNDLKAMRERDGAPEADEILDSITKGLDMMSEIQEDSDPLREVDEEDLVESSIDMLAISDGSSSHIAGASGERASDKGQDEELRAKMERCIRIHTETRQRLLEKGLIGPNESIVPGCCRGVII